MPIFVCSRCRCLDNTATADGYWMSRSERFGSDPLCQECETGEWHGRFEKRQYDEGRDGPIGTGNRVGEFWGNR